MMKIGFFLLAAFLVPASALPQAQQEATRGKSAPKLVIAHHMNAEPPPKAGAQDTFAYGSNTPSPAWVKPQREWSEFGGRCRDMSITNLYSFPQDKSAPEQAAWEIAVAKRAGVDAFAFYGAVPGGEGRVLEYMRAAKGTGFKITLCSGGNERGGDYEKCVASLRRLIEADRELDALLRVDGKLLLLTYGGNWGATVEEMLAKRRDLEVRVGIPLLVTYATGELTCAGHLRPEQWEGIYAAERQRLGVLLDGGFDGLSPFMVCSGDRAEADLRFYGAVCRERGKLYFPSISFQFYGPKHMTHAPVGDEIWRRSWQIANDTASGVQLITWNDWGETTAMAPGVNVNYGLHDMLRQATRKFKTGQGEITEDKAWVMYYRYPSSAEPVLYPPASPRKFRTEQHDRIWVRTCLTAPATIVCEGRGENKVEAGEQLTSFPLTPGPVRIAIMRDGNAVQTLSPPEIVTDRPWRVDHSLVVFGSDAAEGGYRREDFPGQTPRFYSEYGDDDADGLLNWFEGLYFSVLERPATPVGPKDNFNGIPCETAQREFRDPIEPVRKDPAEPALDANLAKWQGNLANALWRGRYRWGEAGLRGEKDGLAIFNPGDRNSREMLAFYDTVPNATYGPLCRWGDVKVKAEIRFDYGRQPPKDWGDPAFALTTRIAPQRRAMYFLRIVVPARQTAPANPTTTLQLGWMTRPYGEPLREEVFAETSVPLPQEAAFTLTLSARTVGDDSVRLTGTCTRPAGTERRVLTGERTMSKDGTAPCGEVGFAAVLPEGKDSTETPKHIMLKSFSISVDSEG
jgi:hypothetical protein